MKLQKCDKGMALLIVLVVVALLTALLTELAFSTMVDLRLVETFRDNTRAHYLAKGGVNAGRMILQDDRNGYDAFDEAWNQGVVNYPVGDGVVSVHISDLDGRLSLNAMVLGNTPQAIMVDRCYRLFEELVADIADPAELSAALIDWIDSGNEPYSAILTDGIEVYVQGAEADYYLAQGLPYTIKNGPLETFEELAMIKGFSAEVLNRIRSYVAIHSQVSVNINTASVPVLMALSQDIDRATAERIVEQRNKSSILTVGDLEGVLDSQAYSALKSLANLDYLDTVSRYYRIESEARVNDGRRRLVAEVDKADNALIFFKVN